MIGIDGLLLLSLGLLTLAVKVWAAVDCAMRPAPAFPAAGKLTKPAWLAITAVAALLNLVSINPLGLLNVVGVVAAIVYLVDVRPAVRGLRPGAGPYG